jgi:hypothetical protein
VHALPENIFTILKITNIYDNMMTLCRMFCPEELELLNKTSEDSTNLLTNANEERLGEEVVKEGV